LNDRSITGNANLGWLVLYIKDVEATIAFYEKHFGYRAKREVGDRIIEFVSADGGANLMVHQAVKAVKQITGAGYCEACF
jgi:predicted enzyme related to lactoylglutathione lyase